MQKKERHPKTDMTGGNIKIRQGNTEDVQNIRSLTRDAYAKWVPLIGREPLPMSADYEEALRKHRFDLLFVDETLAALIETISHEEHLLIENVAVSPAFQGKGLGRKLLAHAEQLAASLGYAEIKLYTNKLFAENLTFYGQLDYQIEREEDVMGSVCVHMNKII
ncbi:MAG: GNAT family N-acetyltransferase [Sneathiella sp.]|nr:GNAT family N-acetyltransferase [Sneathiella sp.]